MITITMKLFLSFSCSGSQKHFYITVKSYGILGFNRPISSCINLT